MSLGKSTGEAKMITLKGTLEKLLDNFHALMRVSSALPKKHSHFYNCLQDLRLVFRDKGDNGPVRRKPTPSPEILMSKMQHFHDKWKAVKLEDGGSILTQKVMNEIDYLKSHMHKGCLRETPSKFGTKLTLIHQCGHRIGVELAVALLSIFFYSWNQVRSGKKSTSIIYDLLRKNSNCSTNPISPCFGIGISNISVRHCFLIHTEN
jgi:hypothetical protein